MAAEVVLPDNFLSSEDWAVNLTVTDAADAAFDLTGYTIKADFRASSNRALIDECTTENGKISVTDNVVSVTSYAAERTWTQLGDTRVVVDVMGYKAGGAHDLSVGLGRFIFYSLAS